MILMAYIDVILQAPLMGALAYDTRVWLVTTLQHVKAAAVSLSLVCPATVSPRSSRLRPALESSDAVQGFGVGAAAIGTTISVYAVGRLMMNLPAGILADRYGRKPLLVWGPLITAFGMHYTRFDSCRLLLIYTHSPDWLCKLEMEGCSVQA